MEQVQCREVRHSYDGVRDAVSGLSLALLWSRGPAVGDAPESMVVQEV